MAQFLPGRPRRAHLSGMRGKGEATTNWRPRFVVTGAPFLAQSRSMTANENKLLPDLGFLRLALLAFALLNILLPLIETLVPLAASGAEHNLWSVATTVIAPVMAPLLMTVILFDYIMSRVQSADAEGAERAHYAAIGRIELAVIALNLLFWIPYFTLKFI